MKNCILIITLTTLLFSINNLNAQQWEHINALAIEGYFVCTSSELPDPNQGDEPLNRKYSVANLFDGDFTTSWVEGVDGNGVGQFIYVSIPEDFKTINIVNGYGKSKTLFSQNNRVKRLKATLHVGINPVGALSEIAYLFKLSPLDKEFFIDIYDKDSLQTIDFPDELHELNQLKEAIKKSYFEHFSDPIYQMVTFLKLEIVSVYKGSKYDDTCISEIFFNQSFVADYRSQRHSSIVNIYTHEGNDSQLLIDTPNQNGILLIDDPESVFQIIDISSSKRWATVIKMPSSMNEGRTETEYLIINTHLGKVMNSLIEKTAGTTLYSPLFLNEKKGELILEHSTGEIRLR
ncbi:MAG: hypothetical protein RBT74_14775 [Tenuifilaceae bacterium]|jgi:hypothetical protein|nr:hypothetical protein [Tenuifilaceae bacterium]